MFAADLVHEQGLPVRDYYTRRLLNGKNSDQIQAQQDVPQVRQMYLSTSLFDNAKKSRGSFQALRVNYCDTNDILLLWKKKGYVTRLCQASSKGYVTMNCKSVVGNLVLQQ